MRFERQRRGLEYLPGVEIERASIDASGVGTFSGYGSVFNVETRNGVVFLPGVFKQSLAESASFPLLWSHDPDKPIGRLTAREDAKGLFVEARINRDVAQGVEAYNLVKAGDVDTMSVGYIPDEAGKKAILDRWLGRETGPVKLAKVDLLEVSLVSIAGNPQAKVVKVESVEPLIRSKLDLKNFLRAGSGLPRKLIDEAADAAWAALEGKVEHAADHDPECSLCGSVIKRETKAVRCEDDLLVCFECASELGSIAGRDEIDPDRVARHVQHLTEKLKSL